MKIIILTIIISTLSSIFAGPGGTGGGTTLILNLQSINDFRELVIESDEFQKEVVLSQIDNLTLEESDEIKYIENLEEAFDYLMAPKLESIQFQNGQLISK